MDAQSIELDWPAIIAAIFIGIGTLITALTASAVLILQVTQKRNLDKQLQVIDSNVNGNFTRLQNDLTLALEYLNTLQPAKQLTDEEKTQAHRRMHGQ